MGMKPIITLQTDLQTLEIIKKHLSPAGEYIFLPDTKDTLILACNDQTKSYPAPIRLGKILDDITRITSQSNEAPRMLAFGPHTLDCLEGKFIRSGEKEAIALTEKELSILKYLHAAHPDTVSKDELLKSVWNYADGVETHTLETHIYRLRQKIEPEPATPEILLTSENGYNINIE